MKKSIRSKYAMYDAVRLLLADKQEIWKESSGFSMTVERFHDQLQQIDGVLQQLQFSTKPVTEKKNDILERLTQRGLVLQGVLKSLSIELGEEEIEERLNLRTVDLRYGSGHQRLLNIAHLFQYAEEKKEELARYSWDTEKLEEFRQLMERARTELNSPRNKVVDLKNKRVELELRIAGMDELLDAMDLMILEFQQKHPIFVSSWRDSRNVIKSGSPTRQSLESFETEFTDGSLDPNSNPSDEEGQSEESPPEDEL